MMATLHQKEVLIVEDEPITRMVASDLIADLGLAAVEAGNADEALEILKANRDVGVLFTDIDMPGAMNGIELAQKVHEHWPHIELIVTSGANNVDDADLPDHGTFIRKPYRLSELAETVEKKLGSSD
jgi:CheY-like chemotaxis protein